MGNELIDSIANASVAVSADVIELRRAIHRQPELGLELPKTQRKVLDALEGLGLDISTGTTSTSVVADLHGTGDGPTILLRADMDALPLDEDTDESFKSTIEGAMHACGHDAHTAMLLGAARVMAEHRSDFAGTVRFMFQPGEEGFHGAKHMIAEGVLEGVERSFALHVTPNLPTGYLGSRVGAMLASADVFQTTVTGKGGHASMPHGAIDPIPATCEMVPALQTMVTRNINAFDPAVLTVAHINAGTTNNVIPETAFFEGTIRTFSERTRAAAHRGVHQITEGIAAAHGCTIVTEIIEGYGVTTNHPEDTAILEAAAGKALGPDRYVAMPTPIMGAEDFSYLLNEKPGAMGSLGMCPADISDPTTAAPLHSNRMRMNEDALANGVAIHVATALLALSRA